MELSGQILADATFPREIQLASPVEQVAGLALKKVWTLRKLEGTIAFIFNRTTIPRFSIL
jgi:hypothetical protein